MFDSYLEVFIYCIVWSVEIFLWTSLSWYPHFSSESYEQKFISMNNWPLKMSYEQLMNKWTFQQTTRFWETSVGVYALLPLFQNKLISCSITSPSIMKILLCPKKYISNHSLPKNNKWFSQLRVVHFWQCIIIHLQLQTSPHKIHILELFPSSSSHWSLSFCTTKDHTGQPNYETHDDISFSFLHKMPISDDLLASSLHDNSHRLHIDNHLHLLALPSGTWEHNRES